MWPPGDGLRRGGYPRQATGGYSVGVRLPRPAAWAVAGLLAGVDLRFGAALLVALLAALVVDVDVVFADRRGGFFGAGPRARRSASSSAARSSVSVSTSSPRRRLALVSPSVTYGPNRPSRSTIGRPLAASTPNSRSGAAAATRCPRRCLG